jgi:SAM-dependent methyltransferase
MKFRHDAALEYFGLAPAALVIERLQECRHYPTVSFERPILDLGCGEGLFAKMLFAEKVDTGIDPDARELERARELGAYEELIQCYGHSIPKPDGSYWTVFSNSVLEHIRDLEPVFREVHRILAPGGYFHFTAPSPNFERFNWTSTVLSGLGLTQADASWRAFFNRFWAHYHAYDLAGWEKVARAAGFSVERSQTFASRGACMLNTTLTPPAFPSKILKKLTNRWTLLPPLRRLVFAPVWQAVQPLLREPDSAEGGGLVFLSLRKPA